MANKDKHNGKKTRIKNWRKSKAYREAQKAKRKYHGKKLDEATT